jgi:regulator of protease activity HflC (stomatin/prohibitin superfamily)
MVKVAGYGSALESLRASALRKLVRIGVLLVGVAFLYGSCTARVHPNQLGVEQRRFGLKTGIADRVYEPGLYFVGAGTTMHTFPREIHVLEASYDRAEAVEKASAYHVPAAKVEEYFDRRNATLGEMTHKTIDAINVQTSDGYAVTADVTLLYSIENPVSVAREFGWGSLYVESFIINTFRNSVLGTLGKMNAESFYDGEARIKALADAQALLTERFAARGFKVERLLLRNFKYAASYEKSLKDKKVAVQLTEKNRQESLVNEERARLQQIDSRGNAAITIAESEVNAKIAKIRAESELYSSRAHAKADTEVNVAAAEAKRLKADALTRAGGRYVVALESAKMFDNIDGAVMTPEQYVAFVKNAWALIGVSGSARPEEGAK